MNAQAYFSSVQHDRKEAMDNLRSMILEVLPNAVESMDYKLPTYTYNKFRMCAIASQKNYMALYVMNYDLLKHFEAELGYLNCGKSCIRFKELDIKTIDLLKRILIYIRDNIALSEFYKSE